MTPGEPATMEEARQYAALKPTTVFRLMRLSKNAGWQAIHEGRIPCVHVSAKVYRVPVKPWLESLGEVER